VRFFTRDKQQFIFLKSAFDGAGCADSAGVGFGLLTFGIFRPPGNCANAF
jgi:hypothetical protein